MCSSDLSLQVRAHHLPQLRQHEAAALAVKDRAAEFALERLYRHRQRRLRDAAPIGDAREAALFANLQEVADLAQFHPDSPAWAVGQIQFGAYASITDAGFHRRGQVGRLRSTPLHSRRTLP